MLGTEAETMGMFPSWGKTGNYVVVKNVAKPAFKMGAVAHGPSAGKSTGWKDPEVLAVRRAPSTLTGRTPSLQLCLSQPPFLLPGSLERWCLEAPYMHAATF